MPMMRLTTIARLIDLKVEPFLIATSLVAWVAQRMVRRVCPDCGRLLEAPLSEQLAYEKATGEKEQSSNTVLVVSLAHIPLSWPNRYF